VSSTRKDGERVQLYSHPRNNLTLLPLIVEALARLRSRSCIIDGEAVCCGEDGRPSFGSHPLPAQWPCSSRRSI
jgi:ATP-dependent DNA ligase